MQAVLLDFNGTLFNDTRFHVEAWHNFLLHQFGITLTREEVLRRCIGPANADIFKDFFGGSLSPEEVKRLSELKETEYRAAVRSRPENMLLKKGVPEFLDALKTRNIPFALATASSLSNVDFYLNDLGLKRWFTPDTIVYDNGQYLPKPDPAYYNEAARRLNTTPDQCLIAEDSLTGIQAAIRAHAGRLVALTGTADKNTLKSIPEVYAVCDDFTDFTQYLPEFFR